MEGIEYDYDTAGNTPVKRKFLDTDGTSSDDDKRLRKLEKRARKEEKRAKKVAKALRRESRAKDALAGGKTPRQANVVREAEAEAEVGTWDNPVRLGDVAPTASRQSRNEATAVASKGRKSTRKDAGLSTAKTSEATNLAQVEDVRTSEPVEGPQMVRAAEEWQASSGPSDRPRAATEGEGRRGEGQESGAEKSKRKHKRKDGGDGKGEDTPKSTDKDADRDAAEASTTNLAGQQPQANTAKIVPTQTAGTRKAKSTANRAESAPTGDTAVVELTKKRKRAPQPEETLHESPAKATSTASTPVPDARVSASASKIKPATANASNADGFRAASRKRASTSSDAGPSTPRRSKETDDELRRKLRTSDAVNAWLAEQWRPLPELQRLEGLGIITYVRGKFSADEKAAIKSHLDLFRRVNDLSQSELVNVIMAKGRFKTGYDKFWVETAAVCPGRPIQAVKKFVQREYDPRGNQGPWSKDEDNDLTRAYANHPNEWTKIAMSVGRTEQDCRDRYKNDLGTKDTRATGAWTKDEEMKLIEVVKNVNTAVGNDPLGHEAPWDIVEERMGGTRSRMQCRKKWQGQLRFSEMGNGQRAIFSKSERPFLVKYISRQHVDSEADIDWVKLASGIFSGLPSEALRNAYKAMKNSLKLEPNTSFEDTLSAMDKKWPIDSSIAEPPKLKSSTKELGRRVARHSTGNVASPRVISDGSDVEDSGDVTDHLDPVMDSSNAMGAKAGKRRGRVPAGTVEKLASKKGDQASGTGMISDSESSSDQEGARGGRAGHEDGDEANASEIDDIV